MFSKAKIAQLKTKFSSIDTNDINDSDLRAKAARLKAKQGGFTLLELLVVVAILAAIAVLRLSHYKILMHVHQQLHT